MKEPSLVKKSYMACIYGLYGAIHGILGAIYGCCTLMWYHTWCHVWYHIWCGSCEIRKDAHVTSIHGTMYELAHAKYATTQMSFPYMAPCMKWNLWTVEGRTSNFHVWHHVWSGTSAAFLPNEVGSFSKHCKIRRRADVRVPPPFFKAPS